MSTTTSSTSTATTTLSSNNSNYWPVPSALPNGIVAIILGSLTGGLFLIALIAAGYWARQTLFGRSRPWTRRGEDAEEEDGEQEPPEMWEVWMDGTRHAFPEKEKMDKPLAVALLPNVDSHADLTTSSTNTTRARMSYLILLPTEPRPTSASASAASASSATGEDDEEAMPEVDIGSCLIELESGAWDEGAGGPRGG